MDLNNLTSMGMAPMPIPTFEMSPEEKARLEMSVDSMNKANLENGRVRKQDLGKDDFLKLLITQLTHQDPTAPMEDTQFIAQMAQFTSLEQMTNMNSGFTQVNKVLSSSEAVGSVGKRVDIEVGSEMVSGVISAARRGEIPEVQINGQWYDWSAVKTVYAE